MKKLGLLTLVVLAGLVFGLAGNSSRAASKGDCSGPQECELYVVVDGDGTVTGPSINCPGDCIFQTPQPLGFRITATPENGEFFQGWSGAYGRCDHEGPTCFITLGGDSPDYLQVTATFSTSPPPGSPVNVTVTRAGTGSGSVSSTPAGIDCGATCTTSFIVGTSVTLSAKADDGSTFTGWSGDCTGTADCAISLEGNADVTATFTAFPKVTVSKSGTGAGTVVSAPAGIDCGQSCAASFPPGTELSLSAAPEAKSLFVGWNGACSGSATTCSLTASSDATAGAEFDRLPTVTRLLGRRTKTRSCEARGARPDRRCTPGAVYSDAGLPLVCAPGYEAAMSALSAVTTRAVFTEYRIAPSKRRSYELDRLVPIGLGGSNAIANLDPERAAPAPGYRQKDRLAKQLHTYVCAGKLSLGLAQRAIASNWPALYKRVFGVAP